MRWEVTTPPAEPVVSYAQAKRHLRLPTDDRRTDVEAMVAAATEHACKAMACSLVTRTITAVFEQGEPIHLPMGPVRSIVSVTDADSRSLYQYRLTRVGHSDRLVITEGFRYPLTVVYAAGHGTAEQVPADIAWGIRCHVGTLYQSPESVEDKAKLPVPHQLDAFYRLNSRKSVVG